MIPGFNHNIKHKGTVYHVQTEDSGVQNPHIFTHLFVGGNIVASKKTSYADLVTQDGFEKTVRSLMEEQHKQMLRNLINGIYDNVETAKAYHMDGPAPINTDPSVHSPSTSMMVGDKAHLGRPKDGVDVAAPSSTAEKASTSPTKPEPRAVTAAPRSVVVEPARPQPQPVRTTPPPNDMPPPPPAAARLPDPPPPSPMKKKAARHDTIFGEDLISEKSLDEVILSYLAEDLLDEKK